MYLGQNHSTDSGEGRNKRSVQEFDLDIWNRNISCSLYTGSLLEKSEQIGPKRAKILLRFIAQIYFDLELWHRNVVQGQSTPFNKRQSFNNIWAWLAQRARKYYQKLDFKETYFDIHCWPGKVVQDHYTPFANTHSTCKL